jgi:O-antigen ligase
MIRIILLCAIPGLMFFIFPVGDFSFRLSWQIVSIFAAGVAFSALLSCWWRRLFFLLALAQAAFLPVFPLAYITLMMIAIFLGAAEGFLRIDPESIMDAMCIAALLLSGWAIGQRLGILPYFNIGAAGHGPFNNTAAGTFIALCLPAFFRRKPLGFLFSRPVYRAYAAPALALVLLFCDSITATLAALAAVAVYLVLSGLVRRWVLVAVGCGCAGLLMLAVLQDFHGAALPKMVTNARWPIWQVAASLITAEPFGHGLGSFSQIFPQVMHGKFAADVMHAHNEYLQIGFEMGLQGMVLVCLYPLWVGATAWRKRRRLTEAGRISAAGITALAVSCMGWHAFHIAPLAVLGAAWLGMAQREGIS